MPIKQLLGLKFMIGSVLILSTACTAVPEVDTPSPVPTIWSLTPYATTTPTITKQVSNTLVSAQATVPPLPTATPILYEIQKDDTLSVIAYRHNITLDDILAINPGIDPNFLTIGTTIFIPTGEGDFAIDPSATPFPVQVEQPNCYPTSDGGLWCLALIENQHKQAIENVSVSITLLSADGSLLAQQIGLPPINVVNAESTMPVTVFFSAPPSNYASSHIQLLTALPIYDTTRYLETNIIIEETIITARSATSRGTVEISQGEILAQNLIVAVIAFDEYGNPIGIRKWVAPIEEPQVQFPFEIQVFSLGPPILGVEIISEARP
ncbi:MAG: LysM peptidoglycan-binding domain-containing protein [Chloroflexi bacterium]|nr:LysM peptidoglycan-binding domain-containing protein [Chloroflexota bacterium]